MRSVHLFNHDWLFLPEPVGDAVSDDRFARVVLPHTNLVLPHHNFDNAEYQFTSTYRKRFRLPEPLNGRRLMLDFDAAMIAATVSINGHTFPEHKGGYTPFHFDITDYVNEDGDNTLTVYLDSREREDIPPYGYVVDYLTFGGIYRDVWLRYVEPVHIQHVFARPIDVLSDAPRLEVDVTLVNRGGDDFSDHLALLLADDQGRLLAVADDIDIDAGETLQHTIILGADELLNRTGEWLTEEGEACADPLALRLWSLDDPYLYDLTVTLGPPGDEAQADDGRHPLDEVSTRIGFREAQFRDEGFYLNGQPLKIFGLNRHQTYPYIGAAASARLQARDADIVKYELGCNLVRTSHYPQSPYFLDRCDEIGLLVFEEIPGWQHIGDEAWKALTLRDVRAMIERDRNHASIVIWGVRINESQDDSAFYTATNQLARQLDPTRPTGGVRYFQDSEFLEDVFTFNDFSNGVEEPTQTPHLITEFNGHMFPTKSWDNEERRIEHALRHARIQSQQMSSGGVSGAIGWCAFDYNTHAEFGSGDRICYHGVMDMFRRPKYAAYFYGSQIDPRQRVVLQAATLWSMGDRSEGGNDPLTIFTNCDEVELTIGHEVYGRFRPNADRFPSLPHPPVQVTGLGMRWGEAFGDLHITGYLNGQPVAEQHICADGQPERLLLSADATELEADGMDMTRVAFEIVDRYGNSLPYATRVVQLTLEGPADLIGENPFALIGGGAALYVRARQQAGTVTIRAQADRLPAAEITLTLRPTAWTT